MKMDWYVYCTMGRELQFKIALEQQIRRLGLQDKVPQVIVPFRRVMSLKKGVKTFKTEKTYAGYVFILAEPDVNLSVVIGTLSTYGLFTPANPKVSKVKLDEIQEVFNKMVSVDPPPTVTEFVKDDIVRVIDGFFQGKEGKIEEIIPARRAAKVSIVTFKDRYTPVEFKLTSLEKV
jgi:transcriptional antiterminator NusG